MHSSANRELQAAQTDDQVIAVVRDYLSEWTPRELALLPTRCRPGRIRDGEDIADCAYELTRCRVESQGSDSLLIELETFFAHACRRLSAIDGAAVRQAHSNNASGSD